MKKSRVHTAFPRFFCNSKKSKEPDTIFLKKVTCPQCVGKLKDENRI